MLISIWPKQHFLPAISQSQKSNGNRWICDTLNNEEKATRRKSCVPSLHGCWAEAWKEKNMTNWTGLKGTGLSDCLSFSKGLRCFIYVKSLLAAKCKSFRALLSVPTNFTCWETSFLPPNFCCNLPPPQIWNSDPASALEVVKCPSWIRFVLSNEAVGWISLIVLVKIHMEVWYLIKSLPIWNHWGNKKKTILPEICADAKQEEDYTRIWFLPGLCHWFTSILSASHLLCINVLIDGGKPVLISFHRVVLSLTNHHLCKSLDERNHWSSKLLIYITYCTLKQSSH